MKLRVISSVGIVAVLLLVWSQFFNPIFDIFFSLLAAAACYEVTKAVGVKNLEMRIVSIIFAFILPLGIIYSSKIPFGIISVIYVIFLVLLTVIHYEDVKFEHTAVTVYASFVIPAAFSTICLIANSYLVYGFFDKRETIFFTIYGLICSFMTDVCAQLTGIACGKHKMTPILSPKKTWEGAAGGVIGATVFAALALLVFVKVFAQKEFPIPVWLYVVITPLFSVMSMFGDLMASVIKRNYGVKDYSKLIPGHGGIMDRFDSVILVMPTIYVFLSIFGMVVEK